MIISIKITSPHEGNLRAEKIGNSCTQFFCMPFLRLLVYACATVKKREPPHAFFRNHKPNHVLEYISLGYFQNMPIYYTSAKYKLSVCSCYTVIFVHNISSSCPSKGCLKHDTNMHKILSALNMTIICMKPSFCNNTTFSGYPF